MVRTQIELTEKQMTALEELAKKRRVSISNLVREGVHNLLQSEAIYYNPERKQRALAIAGRFKSGRGDMSKRHDDYLMEAYET